ncbi:MAG: BON domain-containing protein [Blastocatellales bacterium]
MRILLIALAAFVALAGFGCEGRNVTDTAITTKVKSRLASDAETSALNINVDTNGGVVTLTGAVPTQTEKAQAEQVARNTEGVTRVVNNITVSTGAEERTGEGAGVTAGDVTILSKIKSRYVAEGIIGTNVDVSDGMVTLRGEVENSQEKARAESIARATEGVTSVKNMLVVKP